MNPDDASKPQPSVAGAPGAEETPSLTTPVRLNALRGSRAPLHLADDLAQLCILSSAARDDFWVLLELHLRREVTEAMGEVAQRFAEAFDIEVKRLVRLVRGCRLLLRSAAMADLSVEQVTIDLNMLCGDNPEVVQQVTAWYRKALPLVRSLHVMETLPDFGAVLQDVRVRKSFIPTSRHLPDAVTPLSSMTLDYREGGQRKRLTVQLTPQIVALLRARCDEII